MFPLLPFAVGLLTGAAAIKLIKTEKTRATLDKVQDGLRNATVSSLAAIEHSSASLRGKLMERPAPAAAPEPPAQPEAAPSPRKPARRKAAAKSADAAAQAAGTAAPRTRRRKAAAKPEGKPEEGAA